MNKKVILRKSRNREKGYVLITVLILLALSAIVVGSSLSITQDFTRSTTALSQRSVSFVGTEQELQRALGWFRTNSTKVALLFSRTKFYSNFDRTGPTAGTNDSASFFVPTKLKLQGTSNSALLTNTAALGIMAFPSSTDSATGTAFNPVTDFATATFGSKQVKVTLVDAKPMDATKDYGDPDAGNPAPDTDFSPIYRVDVMDTATSGNHLFGYVTGNLVLDYGIGFYGKNLLEMRQSCDSYLSNSGAYSAATRRSNCTTGSNSLAQIHLSETVYGTMRTNGSINTGSPFGGKVCADFATGCPTPGTTCEGAACNVPALPTYSLWSVYCPTNQGDFTASATTILNVAGNNPNQKCWNKVTIGNNKVLTLQTTTYSYFIDTFDIPNNSRLNFAPNPSTGTINLYVRKFVGDKFNGNQVFNTNNKPYQLRIHYLGTDDLTMNGTAAMNAFVTAPYARVNIQGNFVYSGGVKALELSATGSAQLHYDESGDITTVSDTSYRMVSMEQFYH